MLQSMGSQRVGHEWATEQHHFHLFPLPPSTLEYKFYEGKESDFFKSLPARRMPDKYLSNNWKW